MIRGRVSIFSDACERNVVVTRDATADHNHTLLTSACLFVFFHLSPEGKHTDGRLLPKCGCDPRWCVAKSDGRLFTRCGCDPRWSVAQSGGRLLTRCGCRPHWTFKKQTRLLTMCGWDLSWSADKSGGACQQHVVVICGGVWKPTGAR